MVLEHYSTQPVTSIRSTAQAGHGSQHWRGKPAGFWVSVKGEDDWPSWCRSEDFGPERLQVRHVVTLAPGANILRIASVDELDAFDMLYGRDEKMSPASSYSRRTINWCAVARAHAGILIAPYRWERRLDTRISDWYYGWDCASGVIWDARAVEAITAHSQTCELSRLT